MSRPRCCKDLPPQAASNRVRHKPTGRTGVVIGPCNCTASCGLLMVELPEGVIRYISPALIEVVE